MLIDRILGHAEGLIALIATAAALFFGWRSSVNKRAAQIERSNTSRAVENAIAEERASEVVKNSRKHIENKRRELGSVKNMIKEKSNDRGQAAQQDTWGNNA